MLSSESIIHDLKFAVRSLRRTPGFFATAVLCLALGIGANAAIFTVVQAVLLAPLPYPHAERLVEIRQGSKWEGPASWPDYQDWVANAHGFEGMTACSGMSRNLSGHDAPETLNGSACTANLFKVLGVQPALGRGFAANEGEDGVGRVVVLSDALWRRRFGGDAKVLGQTLLLDSEPYTVIGVMPKGVQYPAIVGSDIFLPLVVEPQRRDERGQMWLEVIGRLQPGVSLTAAGAEMRRVTRSIVAQHPGAGFGRDDPEFTGRVYALTDQFVRGVRTLLILVFCAVALVLLIACANVANLLVARGAARQVEISVRLALGAGRSRIVRQLLIESLLLSGCGSLLGAILSVWVLTGLRRMVSETLPILGELSLNPSVFAFLMVVAVASALLAGLVPALQSTRDLGDGLRTGEARTSVSPAANRLRNALVILEVALSLLLLVGAGLTLRSMIALFHVPPGFDSSHVLTAHLQVPNTRYPGDKASTRLLQPVLERIRGIPGVTSAAMVSMIPIQSAWSNTAYDVEEGVATGENVTEIRSTSPDYFRTMRIPLLAGRDFTEADGAAGADVVIVNHALVSHHFNDAEALGHRIKVEGRWRTIIGVVGDVHHAGLEIKALREVNLPYNEAGGGSAGEMALVVRTAGDPLGQVMAVRKAVQTVDPEQPLFEIRSMDEIVHDSLAARELVLMLMGFLAGLAVLLAAVGLYGVISYLVAQRTRELGIRMALGAQAADVVLLVVRQGLTLAGLGTLAGIAAGLLGARAAETLVFQISTRDPVTFVVAPLVLLVVSALAAYLPARRAARVDPMSALRSD